MRVSRSRPCNFGASSLASLTRVCNAIRSALVGKRDLVSAELYYTRILALPSDTVEILPQRLELFDDFVELRFALAHDARRSFLEWLLGWNTLEPALFGELFVAGKIEANEQIHFAIGGRSSFGGSFACSTFADL